MTLKWLRLQNMVGFEKISPGQVLLTGAEIGAVKAMIKAPPL